MTVLPPANYRVRPMLPDLADQVRATRRSPDYGHPVHAEVADGRAPCRVCLEKFAPGEDRRLLLTYDSFRDVAQGLPLPGPIFIHEKACAAGDDVPESIAGDRLTLTAYADDRVVIGEVRTVNAHEVAKAVERLFSDDATQYVHIRSTSAGCFLCQLDRVGD